MGKLGHYKQVHEKDLSKSQHNSLFRHKHIKTDDSRTKTNRNARCHEGRSHLTRLLQVIPEMKQFIHNFDNYMNKFKLIFSQNNIAFNSVFSFISRLTGHANTQLASANDNQQPKNNPSNQSGWTIVAVGIALVIFALLLPGHTQVYMRLPHSVEIGIIRDNPQHSDNSNKPKLTESQHSPELDDGRGDIHSPTK
ncbi:hypothetical protein RIVM261_078450 [Rivularia sp. IAM M-261]|nr:hypothetical protein RIVM261_078450 [Rivularia sp. IAM M-261]